MAAFAADIGVGTFQSEVRIPVMIETTLIPAIRRVAVFTLVAPAAGVGIVNQVAGNTASGDIFELIVRMAAAAVNLLVFAFKGKVRFIVVKTALLPALFAMTVRALFAEVALMGIVLFVAINALMGGIAVFFFRCVAAGAGYGGVFVLEGEVCLSVVKAAGVELHNVSISPLVFGMAGFTVDGIGVADTAVVALLLAEVSSDLFMAGEAEAAL